MVQSRQLEFIKSGIDRTDAKLLSMLLQYTTETGTASAGFAYAFENGNYGQSPAQLSVMSILLKHVQGHSPSDVLESALVKSIEQSENASCRELFFLLLAAGADVNYSDGLSLQTAADKCDLELVCKLLEHQPTQQTVSFAFPHIFLSGGDPSIVSELIDVFCSQVRLPDMEMAHTHLDYPLALAFELYPTSLDICRKLLLAGCSAREVMMDEVLPGSGLEEIDMLMWTLNAKWAFGDEIHRRFIQVMLEEDTRTGMWKASRELYVRRS